MKKSMNNKTFLFVTHDVNRAGAQLFLLSVMQYLKAQKNTVILLTKDSWGSMKADFEADFEVYHYRNVYKSSGLLSSKISALDFIKSKYHIDLIYVNTIVNTDLLAELKQKLKAPIISHIHELPYSIKLYGPDNALPDLFEYSDTIIGCSQAVCDNLSNYKNSDKIKLVHSFVNNDQILERISSSNLKDIKIEFGIPDNKFIVGSCGNADWRKGSDLFLQIAQKVIKENPNVVFVWVGVDLESDFGIQIKYDLKKLNLAQNIILIPPTPKAVELITSFNVFLLSSREDPFPLVMLEAGLAEKCLAGFENSGGAGELIGENEGILAEYLNTTDMANQLLSISNNPEKVQSMGKNIKIKILNTYSFNKSIEKISLELSKYFH